MKKVWVNGTFDILHVGHIKLLEYASSLGLLRVGIDSDDRVKSLKGEKRPYNNLNNRIDMLLSLKSVNDVKSFSTEQELINLLVEWKPDYLVIGDDYKNKEIIGSEYVKNIIFFSKLSDFSSTKILSYYSKL
jgi:D-beta-D-heptose 7-phosphate kinase/D-beta-D-heptose 1-phosphate adenosyltransferase